MTEIQTLSLQEFETINKVGTQAPEIIEVLNRFNSLSVDEVGGDLHFHDAIPFIMFNGNIDDYSKYFMYHHGSDPTTDEDWKEKLKLLKKANSLVRKQD